ncbi:WD40-repeat-containing domain protein [Butyriboletus roseoflavus]|nr:WD40-repeat-containing domain protein [Butyriboletus roseoflavus]
MFATGTDETVSIWRIASGERLVGPLEHHDDFYVTAVRFSPNGERIAAASSGRSIRVFDSRNGDKLITINTVISSRWPITPLAWSNDGLQIFAASKDNKIRLFDVSTGSQLAESQTLNGGDDVKSIALATNGKFIATFAGSTISFLATSTLSQVGPVINDSNEIWAIAMSQNSGHLATGLRDGKITIRDLSGILPDVYAPFHVSI